MIRIFLRLYLLVLLPFTLVFLLPLNPISYYGKKLVEKQYDREFSSVYELVNYELKDAPQNTWQAKIEQLQGHFPFGLELKPIDEWDLKEGEADRLLSQGFILYRESDFALFYRMRMSNLVLRVGMIEKDGTYVEKQTRGLRYLVEKISFQNNKPEKKFEEIKPFFKVPVKLEKFTNFDPKGEIVKGLKDSNIYYDKSEDEPVYMYFSSNDKAYIITAGPLTNRKQLERYYNYGQIILPALLIAIGALIWLYTLLRELKIMNTASKRFGAGRLSTRSKLSKFATLHSQSNAFNSMATQVEKLVDGHRDLTNAVSHELKTPLSRLRFALQMQQESKNKSDQEKYTAKIEDNIDELELLINELLSYARLDRNESLLDAKKHNFAEWVNAEVEQTRDYQPELDVQLHIDDSANHQVLFDQSLLDKVLKNLLSNAIRHCKQRISITAEIANSQAILLIKDDGDGIDEKYRIQLFQPFLRMDKSRDRRTGGSGMGLALSKKIIELHGGTIEYQESQWKGAGFIVKIPLND